MKKAMAILLAAVLALACTACGGSKNGETKDRLAQIKEKGYIELCTEPYFAPYEYVDPNKSGEDQYQGCLLYTSPSPRDFASSRMPSSA